MALEDDIRKSVARQQAVTEALRREAEKLEEEGEEVERIQITRRETET